MNVAINMKNIVLTINEERILNNINLKIYNGEICGLIGRNGSGKSMLMKVICGLIPVNSGEIIINNLNINNCSSFAPDTGLLIEHPGYIPNFSAYDNLMFLGKISKKFNEKELNENIDWILEELGLSKKDKRPVRKYSLGMKQKLGIAQPLFEKNSLILLDEPSNNLDSESIEDLHKLILKLNKEKGTSFMISSHQKIDIEVLCNRVVEIDKGKLLGEKYV